MLPYMTFRSNLRRHKRRDDRPPLLSTTMTTRAGCQRRRRRRRRRSTGRACAVPCCSPPWAWSGLPLRTGPDRVQSSPGSIVLQQPKDSSIRRRRRRGRDNRLHRHRSSGNISNPAPTANTQERSQDVFFPFAMPICQSHSTTCVRVDVTLHYLVVW